MEISRFFFFLLFVFNLVNAQDRPNDDEDDALPQCAASCQASLGDLGGACGNSGAISSFQTCVRGSNCSDDDQEGSDDWITSTCRVISRSMASMSRTASMTSQTSVSASTTSASSSSASTTASSSTTGTTTSPSSSSSSTSSSTSSTATSTPTSTPTPAPAPTGLSTGAKAGIGVAAAIVGLLILGALIWYCARRMRNSRRTSKSGWPANLLAWDAAKGNRASTVDGSERGVGGVAAGAGRFEPQDPYSEPRPLPDQPELGGVMRSELHSQHVPAPPPGAVQHQSRDLPLSLQAAHASAAPTGSAMVELPHEGAVVAGPMPMPYRIPRKQPGWRTSGSGVDGVSPVDSSGAEGGRPVSDVLSPVSAADRRVSTISNEDAASVPLPQSPLLGTSRQPSQRF